MIQPRPLSIERGCYGLRETTEGIRAVIPEICLVGHVDYHTARPSFFYHHQHTDVLEIFYLVRGKVSWWVEGISTDVFGTELFLIWPEEWHGARNDIVEPSEYYWVQVHLPSLQAGPDGEKWANLATGLRRARKLPGTPALPSLYQSLLREHAGREPGGEFVVRATLHLLLALVLRCSQTDAPASPVRGSHHTQLARAIRWTKENVADASLRGMARESGLDTVSFRKHFCAMMGLSPAQYLLRLRLHKAKEQLARGQSITQTAHAIGFGSSQYFATVFRKYEGLSPSDFLTRMKR